MNSWTARSINRFAKKSIDRSATNNRDAASTIPLLLAVESLLYVADVPRETLARMLQDCQAQPQFNLGYLLGYAQNVNPIRRSVRGLRRRTDAFLPVHCRLTEVREIWFRRRRHWWRRRGGSGDSFLRALLARRRRCRCRTAVASQWITLDDDRNKYRLVLTMKQWKL